MKNLCSFDVVESGVKYAGRGTEGIVFPEIRGDSFTADGVTVHRLLGYENLGLSQEEFCRKFDLVPGFTVIVPNFPIAIRAALDAGMYVYVAPVNAVRNPADNSMSCVVLEEKTSAPEFSFVSDFKCFSRIRRFVKGAFPIVVRGDGVSTHDRTFQPVSDDQAVTYVDGKVVFPYSADFGWDFDAVLVPNIPEIIEFFHGHGFSVIVTSVVGPDRKVDLLQVR